MKLKRTFEKNGERFGETEDGREIGPLCGGARNVHLKRIEYICDGKVYWEDLNTPSNPDPEEEHGWI